MDAKEAVSATQNAIKVRFERAAKKIDQQISDACALGCTATRVYLDDSACFEDVKRHYSEKGFELTNLQAVQQYNEVTSYFTISWKNNER